MTNQHVVIIWQGDLPKKYHTPEHAAILETLLRRDSMVRRQHDRSGAGEKIMR